MSFLLVHDAGASATWWDRLALQPTDRVVVVDRPARGAGCRAGSPLGDRENLHLDSGHMAMISIPETLANTLNHIG
ncbi:hypothetical protein [Williamsia muralis]|uniref:hypothetical protein n=1 Tax=Williamsia marianensis TaxID=85044 RepID=UPI000DE5F8B4|nr:hypothetical protein [Williamsia marianensis]PVY30176.1 hypothetical protein C7458_105423 [Williamsia marianensis]